MLLCQQNYPIFLGTGKSVCEPHLTCNTNNPHSFANMLWSLFEQLKFTQMFEMHKESLKKANLAVQKNTINKTV